MRTTPHGKNSPLRSPSVKARETAAHARLLACNLLILLGILFSTGSARGQILELPRHNLVAGDFFGTAVAISGDRILVGATAVEACGSNSGAAYVYERDFRGEWRLVAELVPSDCSEGKFFGRSVDISGDYAVVAASQEFFSRESPNAAYIFERDSTGVWREAAKLTGSSQQEEGAFATSVSIDGTRLLITTSGDQAHGRFGGAAYLFERQADTGSWLPAERFTVSGVRRGIFGTMGVVSGEVVAVAASTFFRNRAGSVYLFEHEADGSWSQAARFGGIDDFFISLSADSGRVLVGESKEKRHGAASILKKGSTWRVEEKLHPSEPYDAGAFGSTVALDGRYALVVGYDEQLGLDFNIDRVVFVFRYDEPSSSWKQHFVIDVGELAFGASLDLEGEYAVIGSASDSAPGTVYVVNIPD